MIFAGRLIPKKGAHIILQALADLPDAMEVDLVILGDGPERSSLERQAEKLGLGDKVHFAGYVQPAEMVQWYTAADLFVLPSRETWGVVVAEALAAGLRVIVSDEVGCHVDMVGDLPVGEVIPRSDVGAWSNAIEEAVSNPIDADFIEQNWEPVFQSLRYPFLAKTTNDHIRRCVERTRSPVSERITE